MKTRNYINSKITFFLAAITVMLSSCEREISDDFVLATFPATADVFIDAPVGLTDEFFISFDPAEGANPEGFGTDENEFYQGTSSIRIDVPASNDPDGGFIGGIFRDRGQGRDLTSYDALTFWAKGNATGVIGEVGFGTDFLEGKFPASRSNIQLTTGWKKYIVPIPNASKLTQEKGMFLFSAGGLDVLGDGPNGNEIGWTFWIDEIKFEKLGTILQVSANMFSGQNQSFESFKGGSLALQGFSQTVNLETGENIVLNTSPAYFDFTFSNEGVASITEDLKVLISGESGSTTVTASLNNNAVAGSLAVTSTGQLPLATTPSADAANVKSVYSDSYLAATSINFNPQFGGSTTQTSEFSQTSTATDSGNDAVLVYSNNNFTGIIFGQTIDATELEFMSVDIFVTDENTSIGFQIRDVGTDGEINTNRFTGQPEGDDVDFRFNATGLNVNEWNTVQIPLGGSLTNQKNNLGAIILTDGPNYILDNIYFYKN